jgi:predicted membrane protein
MSIFHADTAFALELIALALGVFLVVWFKINKEHVHKLARFLAYLIIVLAIIALLCTSFYSIKYWTFGYFHPKAMMMMKGKMSPCQMNRMNGMNQMMPKDKMKDMDSQQQMMEDNQHMIQQKNMQDMPMKKMMDSNQDN